MGQLVSERADNPLDMKRLLLLLLEESDIEFRPFGFLQTRFVPYLRSSSIFGLIYMGLKLTIQCITHREKGTHVHTGGWNMIGRVQQLSLCCLTLEGKKGHEKEEEHFYAIMKENLSNGMWQEEEGPSDKF